MIIENFIFWLVGIHRNESNNGEYPDMVLDMQKLFRKASYSIQIVSGGFSSKVYCTKEIQDSLDLALKKKCLIEVIVGPDADKECVKGWISHGIPIYFLDQNPDSHFALVDGKHVRVEEPHKVGYKKRVQYIIYNFKNAEKLSIFFEELKKRTKVLGN